MAYHAPFELDLALALKEQLVTAFEQLEVGKLNDQSISEVRKDQGVYKLFYQDVLVYVGKADNLNKRLLEHFLKISGRMNIAFDRMGFKCLYVGKNWTTLAPEESLIKFFKTSGEGQCEWNGNGFGPHDPGRERESTNKSPDGFDAMFPIQHMWPCTWIEAREWLVIDLLLSLKEKLPFLLRYETDPKGHYTKGHADHRATTFKVSASGLPAHVLLGQIAAAMPGWQATRFPGHMILYKENKDYRFGTKL